MSRLAVVVVVFGGDPEPTLAAVRAQLRDGDELEVWDNGAGGENLGFAGGANAGVARTSAELVLLLNPDAVPQPGALDALRAAADAHPDWGLWQALVTLPGGTEVNTAGNRVHPLGISWAGGWGDPVAAVGPGDREVGFASGAALCVRRTVWDALGGFDASYFLYAEDLDLSLRARLAGWQVGLARDALVEHDYAFDKGAQKWFFLERNRLRTVLAVWPPRLLLLLAPALLALELLLLPVAAAGGWLGPKLRADLAVARELPAIRHRRRAVQATRRCTEAQFAAALTTDLDGRYFGRLARRPRWLAPDAALFALVRRAL